MKVIHDIDVFCKKNIEDYVSYEPYPLRWKSYILNFKKNKRDTPLNNCVSYIRKLTENTTITFSRDIDLHHIYQNGDIELIVHLR